MNRYKHAELPDVGNAFRETLALVRAENPVPTWSGPSVAFGWDKDLGLPIFDDSRGYPVLLVDLPLKLKDEVDAIANCGPEVHQVMHLSWAPLVTVFALKGKHIVLELVAADLLPLLRLSNQGCILVVLSCGDEVVVVEYGFFRQDFLELCSFLFVEPTEVRDRLDCTHWNKRFSHTTISGVQRWQPIIGSIDDEDRF
jgi:hypothetical protein